MVALDNSRRPGLIVFNTLDNRTIAVDALTGEQRWTATLGEIARGETMTMAPLVVKDKVLVGNSGGELGVRGWLTALDLHSGRMPYARQTAVETGVPRADVQVVEQFAPGVRHVVNTGRRGDRPTFSPATGPGRYHPFFRRARAGNADFARSLRCRD
jgi:glucose dehydrogenase